jgi:hypothetical protein
MTSRYAVLAQRLRVDWGDARKAADKARRFHDTAARGGPAAEAYLEAAALNLHGFYNGVEHVFEWIARELDGGLPRGATWHRDLLDQMALDLPGSRPPVLGPMTRTLLAEYLGFRHLVRNLYTWDFAPAKIHQLVELLPETLGLLDTEIAAFARFLETVGADEGPGRPPDQ